MKPITHAQKALMLQYFEVLEVQLRRAIKEASGGPIGDKAFVEALAARVRERVAGIATQIPDSAVPSLQQIRKNLEAVLDPVFLEEAKGDPIEAVRVLARQLRHQPEYTRPQGGVWKHAPPRKKRR